MVSICTSCYSTSARNDISNGIHEGGFDAVEDDDANDDDHDHEAKAIEQLRQVHGTRTEVTITESFHNGGHGVGTDEDLILSWNGGSRIDDGGSVHGELDAKLDEETQVTVLVGQRGDDDAEAQSLPGHDEDQERGEQDPKIGMKDGTTQYKEEHKGQEEEELDGEGDEAGKQNRDGHGHARKVDLAKQLIVIGKRIGGLCQDIGKIGPDHGTRHIEEELREAIGGKLGNAAEDEGEDDGGQQRLDQEPERAEDGLLIDRDEVTAHEEEDQVTILPKLTEAQVQETALRFDDHGPILIVV